MNTPLLFDTTILPGLDAWRALADRYLQHEFNVLGSGWVQVRYGMACAGFEGRSYTDLNVTAAAVRAHLPPEGRAASEALSALAAQLRSGYEPIDWHIDFKSGYRYELAHHSQLRYGVLPGVDAKVPADLSRCYQLPILALAWQASGDRAYRQETLAQILDWLAFNPFEYGAAWRANMNVAIRAANWVVTYALLAGSFEVAGDARLPEAECLFLEAFRRSLLDHRRFICRNLEFPEGAYHPNHYVANLAGLAVLCSFSRDWDPEAAAWLAVALRELGAEMDRQVLPDGFDYESATSYHALVLEMLADTLILCARAEGASGPKAARGWIARRLGQQRLERLRQMFGALREIIQPDGLVPLVGDTDAGRFLYLEAPNGARPDWRFLSCLGAALFADAGLLAENTRPQDWLPARLLLGALPAGAARTEVPASAAYPAAGFYVMRGEGFYSLISCGPIGTGGLGGHAHNDKLAPTLCLEGREILVDPGIYVYTASKPYRDAFRSVLAHNTLAVAGQEQNRFLENSPWWGCHEDTQCRCLRWESSPAGDVFAGEHQGYTRLQPPVRHRRRIEWQRRRRQLTISDRLLTVPAGAPAPPSRLTFVLHPECRVVRLDRAVCVVERQGVQVRLATGHGCWEDEPAAFSPSYGIRQPCRALVVALPAGATRNTVRITW